MDFRKTSEQLCQLHFEYAGVLNRLNDGMSSRGEDGILIWLMRRSGSAYATDIIQHFELSAGRVANIVRQLERKGYIRRFQDRDDLRRAEIVLTEEGRAIAAEKYEQMIVMHQKLLEKMEENDAMELIRILRCLLESARKNARVG